jgi:tetratricopeptide (TPR) repeat protein
MLEGDHDRGFSLVNKALSIEPASAHGWAIRGWINTWYEQIDQGYADFRRAHRLSPSNGWSFLTTLGFAYTLMQMGRAEEGLQWARRICEDRPLWSASYRNLIACLVNTGQLEKARQIVKVLLELEPGLTISAQFAKGQYKRGAAFERFARALRQAGVPE